MSRKWLQSLVVVLVAAAVWTASADTGFAHMFGHRRYPSGSSPTYPNATPHGGFSSSNGYYSGRSRIVDVPATPVPVRPATAK